MVPDTNNEPRSRAAGSESGIGLVELLIAMTVMSIGIMALVAGFGSGIEAIKRSSKSSTAGTIADRQLEKLRRGSYAAPDLNVGTTDTTTTGADGRTYWIRTEVSSKCPDETTPIGSPPSCTLPAVPPSTQTVQSRPVKLVTLTVRDGTATAPVLLTQSSTFDQSTG